MKKLSALSEEQYALGNFFFNSLIPANEGESEVALINLRPVLNGDALTRVHCIAFV
jgi:hypothetical protein